MITFYFDIIVPCFALCSRNPFCYLPLPSIYLFFSVSPEPSLSSTSLFLSYLSLCLLCVSRFFFLFSLPRLTFAFIKKNSSLLRPGITNIYKFYRDQYSVNKKKCTLYILSMKLARRRYIKQWQFSNNLYANQKKKTVQIFFSFFRKESKNHRIIKKENILCIYYPWNLLKEGYNIMNWFINLFHSTQFVY